jgi:hypothetical protein
MKIQLRNKGLELENLQLRQKAEKKIRPTIQPTQGPPPLTSPSYAAAAGTQAPGVTKAPEVTVAAPLSLSPNDIQVEILLALRRLLAQPTST